jgi:diphosphomevalonate decarboxylase
MQHTSATSPYYASWIEAAPQIYAAVREAVISRDIHRLGEAAEHSALAMHACMLAARPALVYLTPTTLRVLERVRKMRKDGLVAYATMDAGPHVKVLSLAEQAAIVSHSLTTVEGVVRVISCSPGPGARVVVDDGPLGAKA